MNIEKKFEEIEEIAKTLCGDFQTDKCYQCSAYHYCDVGMDACVIYEAGYRKQKDRYQILPNGRLELIPTSDIIKSDVAREIFEDIKATMFLYLYEHKPFGCCEYVQYFGIDLERAIEKTRREIHERR